MFLYYAVLNSRRLVATNCGSTLALVIKHGTSQFYERVDRFQPLLCLALLGVTPRRRSTALVKRKHGLLLKRAALGRLGQTIAFSKRLAEVYTKSFADFNPQLRNLEQL